MPDIEADIFVCAGPPACTLEGDDAVRAAETGCVWCRVITIQSDGTEIERGPSHA